MSCAVATAGVETGSPLSLADIVRAHAHELGAVSPEKQRVLSAIASCRTAALGGHVAECDQCHKDVFHFNSCRNRHCPRCGGLDGAEWVEARRLDLLPLEYFHGVFTLPDTLNPFFRFAPRLAYRHFFAAVSETLQEVALNPKHLGARIGFTAVLHTWSQQLRFHPHLHCIVPGGGLSPDGSRFVHAKRGYLLPVKVLSAVVRGKLLSKLERAIETGELVPAAQKPAARARLRQAAESDWVVYSKPPMAGPEQVVSYLGRYTHRVAISDSRLRALVNGQVSFRYKDRAHGNRTCTATLPAAAFLDRFLLHVLPSGMMRIRHYGLLANPVRRENLARCRELLDVEPPAPPERPESETWQERLLRLTGIDASRCPHCKTGHLVVTATLHPLPRQGPIAPGQHPP